MGSFSFRDTNVLKFSFCSKEKKEGETATPREAVVLALTKGNFSQLRDKFSRSDSLKDKRVDGRGVIAGERQR